MTSGPTPPPVEVTSAPVGIFQHLLPNGRAFRITATKYLRKFFEGLTAAMIPPFREAVDTAYQDLPPATTTRLADWQSLWGIMYPSATDPRSQLTRAWSYQGSPTLSHIQAALRAEGFDVYVHDGYGINPLTYIAPTTVNPLGAAPLGYPLVNKLFTADKNYSALCGEEDIACGEIEASCGYYQYSIWTPKLYVVPSGSPYFVYIGGQTLGQLVYIDPVRRNEFEALCLKLVPSNLWIGAMVLYNIIVVTPPTITHDTVNGTIVMLAELGAVIYYTIDGSTPTTSSILYSIPITFASGTYKAIAFKFGVSSTVTTETFSPMPPSDYTEYLKFDGNTNDETGNYPATNFGAVLASGVRGLPSTAYQFDGADYMQNAIGNTGGEKSYSVWAYIDSLTNGAKLVSYTNRIDRDESDVLEVTIAGELKGSAAGVGEVIGATTIATGAWYNFAYVRKNGEGIKIYINGSLEASFTGTGTAWASGVTHLLGRSRSSYLTGRMDNVRVYSRAITSIEVNDIYNYEKP